MLASLAGCSAQQPYFFHETGDLSRYIGKAMEIDQPDRSTETLSEAACDQRPFGVGQNEPKAIWDLSLEDAIRLALQNSKVMRSIGGRADVVPDAITNGAVFGQGKTIYDPALAETDARSGVQAALSAFDAQWITTLFWEKNVEPRDTFPLEEQFFPLIFMQDTAQFQTQLTKMSASGTSYTVRSNVTYDLENSERLFSAVWTPNFEVEVRQPLMQGLGTQFNRIAGANAVPGVNQGVVLARLNSDIALADFEAGVRNLVSDVEVAYWELYFAYRNLDAWKQARDKALEAWQTSRALYDFGAKGGEKSAMSQALERYSSLTSQAEQAQNDVYKIESNLRYMMGLAATDGRLIRPADEPTIARVAFDWTQIHSEALCRSVEIRAAEWRVKQREMELIAAKNWLLPRLDLVARYRWLGMGQNLIEEGGGASFNPDGTPSFKGAYENLFTGDFQDWHLGFEAHIPIGFRKEHSAVRNAELAIARARALLQETELEVSHQLAFAIRDLDVSLALIKTNYSRRIAAEDNLAAVEATKDVGGGEAANIMFLRLEAAQLVAQAESAYYRSLADYNKAITEVHYRKGSLLEYNGVYLAEGPWPGKAYFDARRRARARSAAKMLDYGFTMPRVVSRGPYQQFAAPPACPGAAAMAAPPQPAMPELLPTPEPESNLPKPEAARPAPTPADRWSPAGDQAGGATTRGLDLYEPLANPPPAEADRPAPGRQGL
jgi:outer membrane protein TolC